MNVAMTTITSLSLSSYYAASTKTTKVSSASSTTADAGSGSTGATSITLSDAARAAMNQKDFATVTAETRVALDALLAGGATAASINLQALDRRQLFAILSNADGRFTADEQAAAKAEVGNRRDAALAGPLAVARVTDDIEAIYTAALAWLDGASTEEKGTSDWIGQRAALLDAQRQLAADPSKTPTVEGDIVADYIRRATAGETGTTRAFADVASDARAALDKQIADAEADGTQLVFSKLHKNGRMVDLADFDSRSLSAIALNQGGIFSTEEVLAGRNEIRSRSSATLLAGLDAAAGDSSAFAKNLLSAYGSMTPEERQAAGWSEKLHAAAVASYRSATQMASLFGDTSTDSASPALSLLGGTDTSSTDAPSSLADFLN